MRARESLLKFWPLGEPWDTLRQRIADDDRLIRIVARTSEDNIAQEQTSRVLFAAMAYLARKHAFAVPTDPAWSSFRRLRDSLVAHETELVGLLQRPAQVNDPLRCVGLYPGLVYAASRVSNPIALVEIGPSLGLNLCMDQFSYEYVGAGTAGRAGSRCRLAVEVDDLAARGRPTLRRAFPSPDRPPVVKERIGLELHPVSLDADSLAWMRAFHFPHSESRFEEALAIRRRLPVRIVPGDATKTLAQELSRIPVDRMPLVFHTAVAYQMSDEARTRLSAELARAALSRRLMYMTLAEEPARRGGLIQLTDLDLMHDQATRNILGFISRWDPVPKLEWVCAPPENEWTSNPGA